MSDRSSLFRGKVKNGVVVPEEGTVLPEGADVEFEIVPNGFTAEEAKEFAFWQQAGNEAWALIDQWEQEDDRNAAR